MAVKHIEHTHFAFSEASLCSWVINRQVREVGTVASDLINLTATATLGQWLQNRCENSDQWSAM